MGSIIAIFFLFSNLLVAISGKHNKTTSLSSGLCLEKIENESYLNMAPHPDGSDRAFFSDKPGKVWLASIPPQGSRGTIELNESNIFVDLTDQVYVDNTFGLLGLAFHSDYTKNGRFFASFTCDSVNNSACVGKCACNLDVGCDPSQFNSTICRYHSVIAEYYANVTASNTSMIETASNVEVRRILTIGLPFTMHPGGQIMFGPKDKYLYCMIGDGGGEDDFLNFSQNKKSLLGKVLRIDIDNMPRLGQTLKQGRPGPRPRPKHCHIKSHGRPCSGEDEINNLDLWGNYSIPTHNPYIGDNNTRPEIWASGLRNPWRCSFDSERPSYFMCGDVGTDVYEEVDIITKGGNYGWRVYEGPFLVNPTEKITDHIFPVLGYNHTEVNNNNAGPAAVIGGYFYRSTTDMCLNGRYIYGDLYGSAIWTGTEDPQNSGNFTTSNFPFTCAPDSPMQCDFVPGSFVADLGLINSFGEDNNKDLFILATNGVYRVVNPTRCNYTCS